jgi:hypothetical protein
MAGETMTPNERLWAAIRLEKPDRVPVIPTLLPEPAAGLAGISQASIAADNRVAVDAVCRARVFHFGPPMNLLAALDQMLGPCLMCPTGRKGYQGCHKNWLWRLSSSSVTKHWTW